MGDTQLHLRWHSHNVTFTDMLQELHIERSYTDVSLICDGGIVRAHKAVLSLASPYLATVLSTGKESDEAPVLLPEIPVQAVRYLISFIYRGQVEVPQQHIACFLNTGKHLHVHGLEQGDRLVDSPSKSDGNSSTPSEADEDVMHPLKPTNTQLNTNSTIGTTGNSMLSNNSNLGNNNIGERKPSINHTEVPSAKSIGSPKASVVNVADIIKQEDLKVEKESPEEGKIDLNFYLQQAIQSASMPCPLCHKEFKSQSGLRDHIRLHTGERPFVCEFCHMNFARASHLKRHRRMHTGEKPFECSICGKDFSRGDKLKDHLRRHEAEDKLTQIRKQILNLDDKSDQDASPASLGNSSNATSFSSITSMPASMSSNKSSRDLLKPPAKRQCVNPKVPLLAMSQMPTGPLQNLIASSQSENINSQMMGVTSIGECILRPIN